MPDLQEDDLVRIQQGDSWSDQTARVQFVIPSGNGAEVCGPATNFDVMLYPIDMLKVVGKEQRLDVEVIRRPA